MNLRGDTEFSAPRSRISTHFFRGWFDRLFCVFFEYFWDLRSSSNRIGNIFFEFFEYIFNQSILEGMKGDNSDFSSDFQVRNCLFDRIFYRIKFMIYFYTKCLEYTKF